jgi:hypothetical protein
VVNVKDLTLVTFNFEQLFLWCKFSINPGQGDAGRSTNKLPEGMGRVVSKQPECRGRARKAPWFRNRQQSYPSAIWHRPAWLSIWLLRAGT